MKLVDNVKVYGLAQAVKESKYPMLVDVSDADSLITERQTKLAHADRGSGHDNFLKGIVVRFDLTFSIKAWTEAERYHFLDIVSSQSTMHRIAKMDFDKCCNEYVTENTKKEIKRLREKYWDTSSKDNYLRLLYNCPTGLELTAGMVTNYQQLKTIYAQRKDHRLPEWREFCEWIRTLPHSEWITGEANGNDKEKDY